MDDGVDGEVSVIFNSDQRTWPDAAAVGAGPGSAELGACASSQAERASAASSHTGSTQAVWQAASTAPKVGVVAGCRKLRLRVDAHWSRSV